MLQRNFEQWDLKKRKEDLFWTLKNLIDTAEKITKICKSIEEYKYLRTTLFFHHFTGKFWKVWKYSFTFNFERFGASYLMINAEAGSAR